MTQKNCSFPKKSIDTWNGLKKEMMKVKNVHQLKENWTSVDKETGPILIKLRLRLRQS